MYLYFSFPLTLSSHRIQFPNLSSSTILPTNPSPLLLHYSPNLSLTSPHPLFSLPIPHLSSSTILPTNFSPLHYSPSPLLPATTSPLLLHYSLYQFLTTPSLPSSTYILPMAPHFFSHN